MAHQSASVTGTSKSMKTSRETGSTGSPVAHSPATAKLPTPWISATSTASGSQATNTSPTSRPSSSMKLLQGRASSTSAMCSRTSRARTSNARNAKATTSTMRIRKPNDARMKRGCRKPKLGDWPDVTVCMNV